MNKNNVIVSNFNLAELIIIIAIIAIFAGLVLPVIAQNARGDAKSLSCQRNLKNLATAHLAYVADNGGFFVSGADKATAPYWTWNLVNGKYATKKDFSCPGKDGISSFSQFWLNGLIPAKDSPSWRMPDLSYNAFFLGMGMSDWATWAFPNGTSCGIKLDTVKDGAKTLLGADAANSGNRKSEGGLYLFAVYDIKNTIAYPMHSEYSECNVVWVDGHVSSEKGQGTEEVAAKSLYSNQLMNALAPINVWNGK